MTSRPLKTSSAPSARRTLLIAQRDFMGYVKTWGFWLTALGPFFGILFGMLAPFLMAKSEPTLYVSILDETGLHSAGIEQLAVDENARIMTYALKNIAKFTVPRAQKPEYENILKTQGPEAAKDYIRAISPRLAGLADMPESKLKFAPLPAPDMEALQPFIMGTSKLNIDGAPQTLNGVLHIYEQDGEGLIVKYWSTSPTKNAPVGLADRYFRSLAQEEYLQGAGLSAEEMRERRGAAPKAAAYNPAKSTAEEGGQKVSSRDRIPYFVAAVFSALLWFTVFTGAYMLLVSMVEEKINKVLEMLLASTQFSEIFFGKLLGVAALTLASLLPWILLGIAGFYGAMHYGDGALASGLAEAISAKMLIFLFVFFVLGYVFYGSIFIALGALAESMQDASTLMTPMVLLLTACIMVVPIGIAYPDSSLLTAAQWFPFSAPFAALIRLPSDPPLWETLSSALVLVVSSVLVVWLSARLFKHGVLSGGGSAMVKNWLGGLFKKS